MKKISLFIFVYSLCFSLFICKLQLWQKYNFWACLALSCLLTAGWGQEHLIFCTCSSLRMNLHLDAEPLQIHLPVVCVCLFLESAALNSTSNAMTSKWPCCSPCGWAREPPSLIHYRLNASLDRQSNPEHHTHLNMQIRACVSDCLCYRSLKRFLLTSFFNLMLRNISFLITTPICSLSASLRRKWLSLCCSRSRDGLPFALRKHTHLWTCS